MRCVSLSLVVSATLISSAATARPLVAVIDSGIAITAELRPHLVGEVDAAARPVSRSPTRRWRTPIAGRFANGSDRRARGSPPKPSAGRRSKASLPISRRRRARLALLHQPGIVPDVLAQAVLDGGHDLAVVGRAGRGDLGLSLLGRTAQTLLAVLPCDILIARKVTD